MKKWIIRSSLHFPKTIMAIMALITVVIVALAINRVYTNPHQIIDTDPENMLDKKEHVRVFHEKTKAQFKLFDIVAMGIYHPGENGVFTPEVLQAINHITDEIIALKDQDFIINKANDTVYVNLSYESIIEKVVQGQRVREVQLLDGIIFEDIMALNQVEDINGETGSLVIKTLMSDAPQDQAGADLVRKQVDANPLLADKLVSADGKIIGIYVPIKSKSISYNLAEVMNILADKYLTDIQINNDPFFNQGEYIVAGLPVAQDTFGKYMFSQMAVSAPLAGLVIFILLFVFFRHIRVITAPMIMAILSITWTMGLLIATGYTVHIMSSMIPIFLFPIAVLNSIHVISSMHKKYGEFQDVKKTIMVTMDELFSPMLFTSITTVAGFISLMLTPIPPAQIFGGFVGIGVAFAWLLSVTFLPAYMSILGEKTLDDFGHKGDSEHGILGKISIFLRDLSQNYNKAIIGISIILFVIAGIGISKIIINDNPVNWFKSGHPLRHASELMNDHVSGTYMSNIVFEFDAPKVEDIANEFSNSEMMAAISSSQIKTLYYNQPKYQFWGDLSDGRQFKYTHESDIDTFLETQKSIKPSSRFDEDNSEEFELRKILESKSPIYYSEEDEVLFTTLDGDPSFAYLDEESLSRYEFSNILALMTQIPQADAYEPFKSPINLTYMDQVQKIALDDTTVVGAISSINDILKKVSFELRGRDEVYKRLPETKSEAGQYIFLAKGGENPDDIHKFITREFDAAHLWLHLNSGDNQEMVKVVQRVNSFIKENPPPIGVKIDWAGMNYINTVWQDKMVGGMMDAFVSSFLMVFIMVTILFRSIRWGVIAMIPITLTVALIYASIGYFGKPYDMPIAVLSSLTLGLSIDFGIHFIERARQRFATTKSYKETMIQMFGEPATAMLQNTFVISIGFVPLFLSDLVPYVTVGSFFFAIMMISGFSTLIILPAISKTFSKSLFKSKSATTN